MTDVTAYTADENRNIINCNTLNINAGGTSNFGSGGQQLQSVQPSLTAHAGGGQAAGTPITSMAAFVSVAATTGDSVTLPVSVPGMEIAVIVQNVVATTINVFPALGENINGGSANASVTVAKNAITIFFCGIAGQWWTK